MPPDSICKKKGPAVFLPRLIAAMVQATIRHGATCAEISDRTPLAPPGTCRTTWSVLKPGSLHPQSTLIKFVNVPDAYDLNAIKHASYVGAGCRYSNGETWLILDKKRLFVYPDYWVLNFERGDPKVEDWPIMSPNELRSALKKRRPLTEYVEDHEVRIAKWCAALPGHEQGDLENKKTAGC